MPYFSGRVHSVVYEDPTKAFYILRVTLDDKNPLDSDARVVVRGHIPGMSIQTGTWFGFDADWTTHKEYGHQLVITKAPVLSQGWDADTAVKILSSHGVGETILKLIRMKSGEDSQFLKNLGDENALAMIPGVNAFTAKYIVQRWQSAQTYYRALDFLNDLGLPSGKVREVWATFGDSAESVLSSNPWELVRVDGITFQHAEEIAGRLGLQNDRNRARGAVLYVTKEQRNYGHMFLTTGQLFVGVQALIPDITKEDLAQALADCHKAKILVVDRSTRPGLTAVYEPWSYNLEKESADLLMSRQVTAGFGKGGLDVHTYIQRLASMGARTEKEARKKRPKLDKVIDAAIKEWDTLERLELSEMQKEGVRNALTQPVSIFTGLPGTGKTTSLKAVVRILQSAGIRFLLCAPTGIAAKRLSETTGATAYTIHRAFYAKGSSEEKRESTYAGITGEASESTSGSPDTEKWGYGPESPHPAEVVIVDEASMIDQHLIYRLLTCTSPQCRMVIVGDAAQLPSVGPGNVLRDMINSGRFPTVNLTHIFRQGDTSAIVYAAHDIYKGAVPECDPESDFSLVQVRTEEEALAYIEAKAVDLYSKRKSDGATGKVSTFQVLSPRHAGILGVTNLNSRLRHLLNPQDGNLPEIRIGDDVIRQEDRIMVIKNDYTLGVFNGDVGKVSRIDRKAKEIEVKIFGDPPLYVCLPLRDAGKLIRLAYACTVHKAQGMEYDYIIMPLVDSFRHQLQRNMLYTAVTRAKKRVFLVGTWSALASAVANDREDLRNTLFKDRLGPVAPS